MYKILAIDYDQNSLDLIKNYLNKSNYAVEPCQNTSDAWQRITTIGNYNLIIINQTMPPKDGIELIKKLKSHENLKSIPIIMQSTTSAQEEFLQAIKAGVYYYGANPYTQYSLIKIVDCCLRNFELQHEFYKEKNPRSKIAHTIQICEIKVKTLEEARLVANYLARIYPDPKRVIVGICELIINAIEHGNLGIDYKEKTSLSLSNMWQETVNQLLELPEHRDKFVTVTFKNTSDKLQLTIKDMGQGFEWDKYLAIDPRRATELHGRGIALASMISFDKLEYLESGNTVVCTTYKKPQEPDFC